MPDAILLSHSEVMTAKRVKDSLIEHFGDSYIVECVSLCADGLSRLREPNRDRVAAILVNADIAEPRRAERDDAEPCDAVPQGLWALDALLQIAPGIPVLVLSSAARENDARLAVLRGAKAYVLESDSGSYLPKAVRRMIEHASNDESLFSATQRAELTLDAIGDAVVSIDIQGNVTFLNPVAQALSGWSAAEAMGRPVNEVLKIVDDTPEHRILSPMTNVIRANIAGKLPPGSRLIRRDAVELAIEDSAAPIHDRTGRVTGAVMVFRDVTQAQATSNKLAHLAQHDYLTDLPNRLLLHDRLSQAIAAARRSSFKLAVLFLDLESFQARQRFTGTRSWRPTPDVDRGAAGERRAQLRHGEPSGRR